MSFIKNEVQIWNTPLINAYLLWRFTEGYSKAHKDGEAPDIILHFIANAILSSSRMLSIISNRRPNFQSFIKSFEETNDIDILLSVQELVDAKKRDSLKAIDCAIATGLLVWEKEDGKLYSCVLPNKPKAGKALNSTHVSSGKKAEVLGKWFSEHDVLTILNYLKVVL